MGVGGDYHRQRWVEHVDIPKHTHGRGPSEYTLLYLYQRKFQEKALFSKVTLFITLLMLDMT